ncbi:MAG: TolC family protein [Rikenellaceae bacterium]|nr:TolC family protein [Rikenellaceae bacterium]
MKNSLVITVLLAFSAFGAAAQPYTLDDCRRMALENNVRVRNSALDRDIARETRREAFTHYFPSVSATGVIFAANRGMAQMDMSVPVALPSPLPSMEIPFSMSMLKHGKAAGVAAMQPVFAGGRIVYGNRLARVGERVAGLRAELSGQEVVLRTEEYFRQVVGLEAKLQTVAVSERLLERLHHEVALAVEAGLTTRNDLLRVELRQQEVASRRLKLENGLAVSKMLLCQYVGAGPLGFEVRDDSVQTPPPPTQYYVDPAEALERRAEYRLLDEQVEASRLEKRMTSGKRMPTVGVGAGYMYHDFLQKDNDFGVVYASVTVPITAWWGGTHATRQAELKLRQAENERRNNAELMEVEIRQTWNDLQEAYRQIMLAEKSVEQSAENMRLNEQYYRVGTATLSDALDAQTLFEQSRNQYTDACNDYRSALTRYLQITGR